MKIMDESLYPKLNDGGMLNFMEDKVKQVQKDLAHYKKIKNKWSVANTRLRTCGISLTSLLAAAVAATAPLSVPIAIPIFLGCVFRV